MQYQLEFTNKSGNTIRSTWYESQKDKEGVKDHYLNLFSNSNSVVLSFEKEDGNHVIIGEEAVANGFLEIKCRKDSE